MRRLQCVVFDMNIFARGKELPILSAAVKSPGIDEGSGYSVLSKYKSKLFKKNIQPYELGLNKDNDNFKSDSKAFKNVKENIGKLFIETSVNASMQHLVSYLGNRNILSAILTDENENQELYRDIKQAFQKNSHAYLHTKDAQLSILQKIQNEFKVPLSCTMIVSKSRILLQVGEKSACMTCYFENDNPNQENVSIFHPSYTALDADTIRDAVEDVIGVSYSANINGFTR